MTNAEARDVCSIIVGAEINKLCNLYKHDDAQELEEVKSFMFSALEKQIPKKPKNLGGELFCPVCDRHIYKYDYKTNYCEKCGQALNWERN